MSLEQSIERLCYYYTDFRFPLVRNWRDADMNTVIKKAYRNMCGNDNDAELFMEGDGRDLVAAIEQEIAMDGNPRAHFLYNMIYNEDSGQRTQDAIRLAAMSPSDLLQAAASISFFFCRMGKPAPNTPEWRWQIDEINDALSTL